MNIEEYNIHIFTNFHHSNEHSFEHLYEHSYEQSLEQSYEHAYEWISPAMTKICM